MKLEQQLRQLSFSGLAAALLLMVCPATGVCDAYHGGLFNRQCGRWPGGLLFLPLLVVWAGALTGVLCRRIIIRRYCWRCAARFIFVLSALKIPSGNGELVHIRPALVWRLSCSGPGWWRFSARLVLLFQALLLAHGGLTTLGANGMSMAVIGPVVGYLVWKMACRAGLRP
ncbi:cobalamin biosynthesis protein [Salmonella enterica subsp. enterica]|uniref:Cobalamin biosynthesis protein n=1 Tax=Salmonella enterica I TaxID=59201 RepID=A0A3S4I348_SALET|nr:cobalamin biosynthesis protein [Salmonella enterica subsp. enterica]